MLERMDEFFERRLRGYDEHMLTEIDCSGEFYRFTASLLPAVPGCRVLDLGCGTGLELEEYFRLWPEARVTGIDLTRGMLEALRAKFPDREGLELICGSYFDLPLGTGLYDAAVSVESLHHFTAESKLGLYRRLREALRDGGYFVLTDYFAESDELERQYFEDLRRLREEQGAGPGSYHYDTPLTAEHEIGVLLEAGFSRVDVLGSWGATSTLRAVKGEARDV